MPEAGRTNRERERDSNDKMQRLSVIPGFWFLLCDLAQVS